MRRDLPAEVDHSKRVRISTMPNVEVLVYPSEEHPGWWIVKPTITSPERDSGRLEGFQSPFRFKRKKSRQPGSRRLARWVRLAVRSLLHHLGAARSGARQVIALGAVAEARRRAEGNPTVPS